MQKTSLERKHKRIHTNHTYTNSLRGSAICLCPRGVIRSPSLLLRNIEYNGTSLNRSSLIFQTQALNPLYTSFNCPSQIPVKNNSTLCKCYKVLSPIWIFRIPSTKDYMSFYRGLIKKIGEQFKSNCYRKNKTIMNTNSYP